MRLTREQIELMAEAVKDVAAEEFTLDLTSDGKLRFSAVEVVERERPLGLTKLRAAKGARRSESESEPVV